MFADIFLACFLANLFAFVAFGLVAWQVGRYLIVRGITKHMPEVIAKAIHGATGTQHPMAAVDEDAQRALAELLKNAAMVPVGVIPHIGRVECRCGATQEVPLEKNLEPYLVERGWVFQPARYGWECSTCTKKAA